ncbi:TauD/TfdA family dioxygenase [Kaarinaea lacus]
MNSPNPSYTIANRNDSPFLVSNEGLYQQWRESKLKDYPKTVEEILVPVGDLENIAADERQRITAACQKTNMAFYQCNYASISKQQLRQFSSEFGLNRLDYNLCSDDDGISALHVVPKGQRHEYIPYSNHGINWHTDGYYNDDDRKIRGMVLHCVSPAQQGGDNAVLDYEIVYLLLRDTNPDYIHAFMQEDAMTIPANVQDGKEIRAEQSGPVFSVDPLTGDLHMRYTARTRSIQWKNDALTRQAVQCLEEILHTADNYVFHHLLEPGQGIISNNVLHTRNAFTDGVEKHQSRLVYRARYYDRIKQTSILM